MNNSKKKKKKPILPARLNLLFFIVFLLFSVLIIRLGVVQIVKGEEFKSQLESQVSNVVTKSVPRGIIYDRDGNVIVGNSPQRTIMYTRGDDVSTDEMLEVAETLSGLIEMDTSDLKDRDKKDHWMRLYPDERKELVTDEEEDAIQLKGDEEGKSTDEIDKEIYQLELERVDETKIAQLTPQDLEILAIYSKMSSGYKNTPVVIKSGSTSKTEDNGVTDQEFAAVSEHLDLLPGVDTSTDWERTYPYGDTLRSILGNVSTTDQGLPSDKLDYYLTRDYNRNDRVGTSYIEQEYEDLLHGKEAKYEVETDENGTVTESTVIYEGERGSDLVLTFDMELTKKVEEIVEDELWSTNSENPHADRAFVVVTNPNTGEVLSMVGKQIVKNSDTGKKEMLDYSLGNITSAYEMGSSVKGATLLMAWDSGAVEPGQTFVDEPLRIKGTPVKGSYTNMGAITDRTAIAKSSNVYMFKSIIAMGGGHYVPGEALRLNDDLLTEMRSYYNQFGLGVQTGIDLPNEISGIKGTGLMSENPGYALDLSIGQYDTYTPLQLAQYVSTIANGGYRLKPQILKEVKEPVLSEDEPQNTITEVSPVVLNRLSMDEKYIDRIQEDFRLVMKPGGTAYSRFVGAPYEAAGKTGTAQTYVDGEYVENHILVAYAPYDNPEVAISVVVPYVKKASDANQVIGRQVLDAYFELKDSTVQSIDESAEEEVEEEN